MASSVALAEGVSRKDPATAAATTSAENTACSAKAWRRQSERPSPPRSADETAHSA